MDKDQFSKQSLMEKLSHFISRATECTEVYYIQVSIATSMVSCRGHTSVHSVGLLAK